ncbi:hypothetical protein [Spiroplasma endosymbiont of Thecophora atra]|uniref:hypothetical protein n=1 Tax=Spiroplasma endosymbiont of Thecophora atra TaxID=3066294 RepID=UPI0030CAF4FF
MYGNKSEYSAILNVEKLVNENYAEIIKKHVDKSTHYTMLTIRKLNKFIVTTRQENKIKEQISSIYRRDLNYKNIEIKFVTSYYDKDNVLIYTDGKNNFKNFEDIESLTYELPKVLVIKNNVTDLEERFYKEFNEEINFNNIKYNLSGFIAISDKFSRQESGFSLIRRGRVIIGGRDTSYRPKDIFGDTGSFTYRRLFDEINLDNWPVSETKDAFDWNDGLEDAFINKIKKISSHYRKTAKEYRVKEKSFNNVSMQNLNVQKVTRTDKQIFNMLNISNNKVEFENFKNINSLSYTCKCK